MIKGNIVLKRNCIQCRNTCVFCFWQFCNSEGLKCEIKRGQTISITNATKAKEK